MTSAKSESKSVHKPIWESSRRPLHPKCVWIESFGAARKSGATNGAHRHFIFDYNLTNSYRPRTDISSLSENFHSYFTLEKAQSLDVMENQMNCLSIVGSGDGCQNDRTFSSLSDRPEMANLVLTKDVLKSFELNDNSTAADTPDLTKDIFATPSMARISNEIDSSTNLLADRVLQWLDLAGGRSHVSVNRNQYNGKMPNASKRRSVTAKESRKPIEHQDESGSKAKIHRQPVRQSSMIFNEDNSVKEAQNPNQTIVSISFGDLFPTTYKCSRKFLALRRSNNGTDQLESLDLQSSIPLKSTNVRKDQKPSPNHRFSASGKGKSKRYDFFEDQYHSMIQRQILETSCNHQVAKRQLHIFMPNLPKKQLIVNDTDQQTHLNSSKSAADNDSCLSCRLASN